jgi:hypothetical protein
MPRGKSSPPSDWDLAKKLALALPGVEVGTSYGTPALRVKKKFIARMWEDGETLVLKLDFDRREALLAADPAVFFTTPHYEGYPSVLIRLPKIDPARLEELLEEAWRIAAPKRLRAGL